VKDLVVILMVLGFFALCVVYVALCDRIVGPDDQAGDGAESEAADGASATATTVGAVDAEVTR
jgi:type IV secretory pathway TrbL component